MKRTNEETEKEADEEKRENISKIMIRRIILISSMVKKFRVIKIS